MKKLLLLILASAGIITAMDSLERTVKPRVIPSIIPGDLVHVFHGDAATRLQKLRFAVLCGDGDYFKDVLPTITTLAPADSYDYKELFFQLMTNTEQGFRKILDHTMMLLKSPESTLQLAWLTHTLPLIERLLYTTVPINLTVLLEYIDAGDIPNDLSVQNSWTTNLKGLFIERLLRGGQFSHILLLANRGIIARNHCSSPLAKEAVSHLDRIEDPSESEYRSSLVHRQYQRISACGDFMRLIDGYHSDMMKSAIAHPDCPVNGRIQACGEIPPLTYASIMLMKCPKDEVDKRKAAEEIVSLLLDHKDVDPNLACANNMPPLCYAVQYDANNQKKSSRAFELLMQYHNSGKKPLNLNARCMNNKSTPIMYALPGLNSAFFTLLAHKDVDVHCLQENGTHLIDILADIDKEGMLTHEERQRAFFGLIERGACPQVDLLHKLIDQPLTDNERNAHKWHALSIAAYKGDGDAVRLLLSRHDILPFPKTATGLTPYKLALIGAYTRNNKKHVKVNPETVVQDIPKTPSAALNVLDEFYACRKAVVQGMQLFALRSGIELNHDMQVRLADSYRFADPVEANEPHQLLKAPSAFHRAQANALAEHALEETADNDETDE